jgi:predicted ATP-grasp superfamily ATP-dependent carboligase
MSDGAWEATGSGAELRAAPLRPPVVIAGLSTRAAAESATRAGYAVTTVDAFGDFDLAQYATSAVSVPRDVGRRYTAMQAARTARDVAADAAVYVGGFENHPEAVRTLARGRLLWGNPAEALARVRDPLRLAAALRGRGFAVPAVRADAPDGARGADAESTPPRWLLKQRASGGGHGVAPWAPGSAVGRGSVLQERIGGVPGSIVFVADGHAAVPLALSRQLVGDAAFGAHGFQYCGSIVAAAGDAQFEHDAELFERAVALAGAVAAEFGLVGVNGVDFVAAGGVPFPIEVNPRYSASMELAERAYGVSVFDAHARACGAELAVATEWCGSTVGAAPTCGRGGPPGALPPFVLAAARQAARASGKAVVYARRTVRIRDTRGWLDDASVRDVPHPGEQIPRGRPVCTVFATGGDSAECHDALVRRAQRVYDEIERGARA